MQSLEVVLRFIMHNLKAHKQFLILDIFKNCINLKIKIVDFCFQLSVLDTGLITHNLLTYFLFLDFNL